ncbi:hypothetical protein SAMN05421630_106284 [Prauserella marina]|uniref:Uncharacterized protein n=1 Tax=Prauserella marina TaxID=530584 RepID=A0A1G6SQ47_9PSEU|nr:hypothetical protein [Prauserella marina]PWV82049.1 hypothetical protein DES30_102284 [Prauserella marina]SDD18286.1 hypothetical protein SAMN05421630_106284 [Prauserella marina]
MRLAASILATLAIAGLAAGCTEHPHRRGGSLPDPAPTVTLTEPAGGPVKDGT